jgi:signal transduction histidine kinase
MSVRWKILIGCLAFVAIIIALGIFTRAQESELGALAIDVYDNALVGVTYVQEAQTDFVRLSTGEEHSSSPFAGGSVKPKLDRVLADIDIARERAISARSAAMAGAVRDEIAQLDKPIESGKLRATLETIDGDLGKLVRKYRSDGFIYRSRSDSVVAMTDRWLLGAVALAALAALVVTVLLGELIVPPIRRAVAVATAIASGKLDNSIDTKGRSETSRLLASLAAMQNAISESRRQERALQMSEAARLSAEFEAIAAQKASRAKSEFLATMSHELRTPLNAILGFSELIREQMLGPVPACYADYANDIHVSGRHLLDLINDVLDISKLEAGKVELHETDVDIGNLTTESVMLVRNQAATSQIAIHVDHEASMPPVRGDERLLKQVLLNLLSNALKFTPQGGAVSVQSRIVGAQGVQIAISDTGIGMTEAEIEIALTPFGQIDSKIARGLKGTGLGLPISRSLIQLHGGELTVHSEPGKGTSIAVNLPDSRILRSGKNQLSGSEETPLAV